MASDDTDTVLREVFSAIDQDGSSTLEKELLKALMFNEEVAKNTQISSPIATFEAKAFSRIISSNGHVT